MSLLGWEGFLEKVGFEPVMKGWRSNGADSDSDDKDDLKVNEKVKQDKTGEADEMNLEVDFKNDRRRAWP